MNLTLRMVQQLAFEKSNTFSSNGKAWIGASLLTGCTRHYGWAVTFEEYGTASFFSKEELRPGINGRFYIKERRIVNIWLSSGGQSVVDFTSKSC